jgi:hypothetical protein
VTITKNKLSYLFLAAAVACTLGAQAAASAASASGSPQAADAGPVPAAAAESGTLSCSQLEALWEEAGGSPSAAFLAAEVARAESSGRQYATNANTNGSTDYGYWQINNYAHPGMATFDPLGNAKAAVAISSDGTNWQPWVTYQHGDENGQCP